MDPGRLQHPFQTVFKLLPIHESGQCVVGRLVGHLKPNTSGLRGVTKNQYRPEDPPISAPDGRHGVLDGELLPIASDENGVVR